MLAKITQASILVLFLALLVQTCRLEMKPDCPTITSPDSQPITRIDTLFLPADTVYRDTTIYKPVPYLQTVAPSPLLHIQRINYYSDTLQLKDLELIYNAQVFGSLQQINFKTRRTGRDIISITNTRIVEREVHRSRFYLGAGIGGSRRMLDDVSISALYSTHRNAYSLDYDLLDRSINAKIYFKLF